MPTIEITQEQQNRLDRGASITIEGNKDVRHVAVSKYGVVYEVRGDTTNAEWRVLRSSNGTTDGYYTEWGQSASRYDFENDNTITLVKLPR